MKLSTTIARAEFTNALIAVYKERKAPTSFLRSFFKVVIKGTFALSIAVQRGSEKIAVDVERGTDGNFNKYTRSTEKIFVPPYYSEYFNINELEVYDRLFTDSDIEASVFADFMATVIEKMRDLQALIERAYELQCAQIFTTGIVELEGVNIDFKRKAGSLVDLGAGNYWDDTGVDPITSITAAGNWLRTEGLFGGSTLDMIMGTDVINVLLDNAKVIDRAKFVQYGMDRITTPQAGAVGQTFHGEISAGSFKVRLWSYNQYYDKKQSNGTYVKTPYLDPKKVIIIPEGTEFILGFAAVPQLPSVGGGIKKGPYIFKDYVDQKETNHSMECRSAGLAIPVTVDGIYTIDVLNP